MCAFDNRTVTRTEGPSGVRKTTMRSARAANRRRQRVVTNLEVPLSYHVSY